MFVTEAVTGGLPVHIAARILGHHSLNTTQAYLAVFQEELIATYRGFLDARRAARPAEEYREPTERSGANSRNTSNSARSNWAPAGAPTAHPAHTNTPASAAPCSASTPAAPTSREITRNLADRIEEARTNGWHGEVQGLQISLDAARTKLASLDRLARNRNRSSVALGMPIIPGQKQ